MKKKLTALFLCLAMLMSLGLTALADGGEVTVTVYATNDMHGQMEESDSSIGIAKVAALAAGENTILVDAGDATQGTSFATLTRGADVITLMNAAGYDVMCAGNHEYDYGMDVFFENSAAADFPILSANAAYNGEPIQGSTVISRAGFDIGFVGLTTTNTTSTVEPSTKKGLTVTSELEAAKREIAALADKGVDAIILLAHMGNDPKDVKTTCQDVLEGLSDSEFALVTAVVDGHSHVVEDGILYTRNGRSVPIVEAGLHLSNLSRLTLTFDEDGVTAQGRSLSLEEVAAMELPEGGEAAAKTVEDALAVIKESQDAQLKGRLLDNLEPVWGGNVYWDYSENRIVETAYGDLVTDAFVDKGRSYAKAMDLDLPVIGLENGGGIAQPMFKGVVTRGDILNAFNHGNTVEVWTINPSQLYTALEVGLTMTGQDETGLLLRVKVSGSFLQVSGFTYTYDPTGEAGAKVTDVTLDSGVSLSRDDTQTQLLLVTTNYIASSFDGLREGEKLIELCGEDVAVQDWLAVLTEDGTVPLNYPITGNRIRYANDKSPETYDVSIPVLNAEGQGVPGLKVKVSVDQGESVDAVTDSTGCVNLTVTKGPHSVAVDVCDIPVYVNNYSGSGTVTTRTGYCQFGYTVDAADPYEDVKAGSWSWTAVSWGKSSGVLQDVTGSAFEPARAATRAEAVTFLWRLAGGAQVDYLLTFPDVPSDAPFCEAVRWAASEGIVSGRGTGFDPYGTVTREELAAMIYRYEQSQGGGFTGAWMFLLDYSDAAQVSSWADEAMHWCVMNGIITGSDGMLRPQDPASRDQTAAMLARYAGLKG